MKTHTRIIDDNIESAREITTAQIYEGLLDEEEFIFPDEDISLGVNPEGIKAAMSIERITERIVRSDAVIWPLVVSCGNQRRQSVVVVAPCGHVGKSQSGLSTCPCGLVVHELEAVS